MCAVTDLRVVAASAVPARASTTRTASDVLRSLMTGHPNPSAPHSRPPESGSAQEQHNHQHYDREHERRCDDLRRPLHPPELRLGAVARVVALGRLAHPIVVVIDWHACHLPGSMQREAAQATHERTYTAAAGATPGGSLMRGFAGRIGWAATFAAVAVLALATAALAHVERTSY